MSHQLRVNLSSPVPPFEQIRAGLAGLISRGELAPGVRLPTVRILAADLGVANGTVARAYRELEAARLVTSQGRRGTAVAAPPSVSETLSGAMTTTRGGGTGGTSVRTVPPEVAAAVIAVVIAARTHGVSSDDLSALVRDAYDSPSGAPTRQ